MTGTVFGVILVELSEIIVSWKETIWDDFWKKKEIKKSAWQLKTNMLKWSSRLNRADNHRSEEQFRNPEEFENFEKTWKKCLTKKKRCDKVNKLSQDRQPW